MKLYQELDHLGLFEWLKNTHDLSDNIITPEYLDSLKQDDIHRTVINASAFRWFREKYKIRFIIQSGMSDLGEFFKVLFPDGQVRNMSYNTCEEAEHACLEKLIEIIKENK